MPTLRDYSEPYQNLLETENWNINPDDLEALKLLNAHEWDNEEVILQKIRNRFPNLFDDHSFLKVALDEDAEVIDTEELRKLFTNAEGFVPKIDAHNILGGAFGWKTYKKVDKSTGNIKLSAEQKGPTITFELQQKLFKELEGKIPGFISREKLANFSGKNTFSDFLNYSLGSEVSKTIYDLAGVELNSELTEDTIDELVKAIAMISAFHQIENHLLPSEDRNDPTDFLQMMQQKNQQSKLVSPFEKKIEYKGEEKQLYEVLRQIFKLDSNEKPEDIKEFLIKGNILRPESQKKIEDFFTSGQPSEPIAKRLKDSLSRYLSNKDEQILRHHLPPRTGWNENELNTLLTNPGTTYEQWNEFLAKFHLGPLPGNGEINKNNKKSFSEELCDIYPAFKYEKRKQLAQKLFERSNKSEEEDLIFEMLSKPITKGMLNQGLVALGFSYIKFSGNKNVSEKDLESLLNELLPQLSVSEQEEIFDAINEYIDQSYYEELKKLLRQPRITIAEINRFLQESGLSGQLQEGSEITAAAIKKVLPDDHLIYAERDEIVNEIARHAELDEIYEAGKTRGEVLQQLLTERDVSKEKINEFLKAIGLAGIFPDEIINLENIKSILPVISLKDREKIIKTIRSYVDLNESYSPDSHENRETVLRGILLASEKLGYQEINKFFTEVGLPENCKLKEDDDVTLENIKKALPILTSIELSNLLVLFGQYIKLNAKDGAGQTNEEKLKELLQRDKTWEVLRAFFEAAGCEECVFEKKNGCVDDSLYDTMRRQAVMNAITKNANEYVDANEEVKSPLQEFREILSATNLLGKTVKDINDLLSAAGLPMIDGDNSQKITIEILEELIQEKFSKISRDLRDQVKEVLGKPLAKVDGVLGAADLPSVNEFRRDLEIAPRQLKEPAIKELSAKLPHLSLKLRKAILNSSGLSGSEKIRLQSILERHQSGKLEDLIKDITQTTPKISFEMDSLLEKLINKDPQEVVCARIEQHLLEMIPDIDVKKIKIQHALNNSRSHIAFDFIYKIIDRDNEQTFAAAKEILKKQAEAIRNPEFKENIKNKIIRIDDFEKLYKFLSDHSEITLGESLSLDNNEESLKQFSRGLPAYFTDSEYLLTQAAQKFNSSQIEEILKAFGSHLSSVEQVNKLRADLSGIRLSDCYSFELENEDVRLVPSDYEKSESESLEKITRVIGAIKKKADATENENINNIIKVLEENYVLNEETKNNWKEFLKGISFVNGSLNIKDLINKNDMLKVTHLDDSVIQFPSLPDSLNINSLGELKDAIEENATKVPYPKINEFIGAVKEYFADALSKDQEQILRKKFSQLKNFPKVSMDEFKDIFVIANIVVSGVKLAYERDEEFGKSGIIDFSKPGTIEKTIANLCSGITSGEIGELRKGLSNFSNINEAEKEGIIGRFRQKGLNYSEGLTHAELNKIFGNKYSVLPEQQKQERGFLFGRSKSKSNRKYHHKDIIQLLNSPERRLNQLRTLLWKTFCLAIPSLKNEANEKKYNQFFNQYAEKADSSDIKASDEKLVNELLTQLHLSESSSGKLKEFKMSDDLAVGKYSPEDVANNLYVQMNQAANETFNCFEKICNQNPQYIVFSGDKKRKLRSLLFSNAGADITHSPEKLNEILAALDDEYTTIRVPVSLGLTMADLLKNPMDSEVINILNFYTPMISSENREELYKDILRAFHDDAERGIEGVSQQARKDIAKMLCCDAQIDPHWQPTREELKNKFTSNKSVAEDANWDKSWVKRLIETSGKSHYFDFDAQWKDFEKKNSTSTITKGKIINDFIYENIAKKKLAYSSIRSAVKGAHKLNRMLDADSLHLGVSADGDMTKILQKALGDKVISRMKSGDSSIQSFFIYKEGEDPKPIIELPLDKKTAKDLSKPQVLTHIELVDRSKGTIKGLDNIKKWDELMNEAGSVALKTKSEVEMVIYCKDLAAVAPKEKTSSQANDAVVGRQARAKGDVQLSNLDRSDVHFLEKVVDIILSLKEAGFDTIDLSELSQVIPSHESDLDLPCNQAVFKAMCQYFDVATTPAILRPDIHKQAEKLYQLIKDEGMESVCERSARLIQAPGA